MASLYGYYTSAKQTTPVYDPGIENVPCPICGENLNAVDLRTISLMVSEDSRSYFYRVHRSCHEPLSEAERVKVDSLLIDAICSTRNQN